MLADQEWRTATGRAPAASIESRGSLCKADAGLLIIGERDGNMPQDRRTAPGHRGPSAPSGHNRKHQGSNPGAYSAFSALKFGGARVLYHPVGLAPALSSHNSLCSHISAHTRLNNYAPA
jgi:hypothetical protein